MNDWLSMFFYRLFAEKVIPTISFLCAVIVIVVVWILLFFYVSL